MGGFLPLGSRPFSLQLPKESAVLHHKEKMSKVKRFWCGWLREKRLLQSFSAGPEITHSSVCVALTTLLPSKGTAPHFFFFFYLRFLAAPYVRGKHNVLARTSSCHQASAYKGASFSCPGGGGGGARTVDKGSPPPPHPSFS